MAIFSLFSLRMEAAQAESKVVPTGEKAGVAEHQRNAVQLPNPTSLTCDQIRIVQEFGEATYVLAIRDGIHNNSPTPIQFTLKAGQSKVVEQANGNPFSLAKDNIIEMGVNAATPPNATDLRDRPPLRFRIQSGPNLVLAPLFTDEEGTPHEQADAAPSAARLYGASSLIGPHSPRDAEFLRGACASGLVATPEVHVQGADLHRTDVGVGEIVMIALDPAVVPSGTVATNWTVKAVGGAKGTLIGKQTAAGVMFTAPDMPGLDAIQATVKGKTYWIDLNIVAPTDVRFRKMQTESGGSVAHKQNDYATGMILSTYIMPDYVSFSRLWVNELNAPEVGTGALSIYHSNQHCDLDLKRPPQDNACTPVPVLSEVLPGFGSRLEGLDCAYFFTVGKSPPANVTGKASLLIGHEYRVGETGRTHPFGPLTEQSLTLTERRKLVVMKGNEGVETLASSPDDGFSCLKQSDGKEKTCGPNKGRKIYCKDVPFALFTPPTRK